MGIRWGAFHIKCICWKIFEQIGIGMAYLFFLWLILIAMHGIDTAAGVYVEPFQTNCNFIKKVTLAQVFSCGFCEFSNNAFFTEQLYATASIKSLILFINIMWVKGEEVVSRKLLIRKFMGIWMYNTWMYILLVFFL